MSLQEKLTEKTEFTRTEKVLIAIAITLGICGLVILLFAIFSFNNSETIDLSRKINDQKFGNFGAFVSGAVGSLWGFVGVILFYITLRLQKRELVLQREELELTRSEIRGQKEQMIQQNATLTQQRFENTFFNMLDLQNDIIKGMKMSDIEGRGLFLKANNTLLNFVYKIPESKNNKDSEKSDIDLEKLYIILNTSYIPKYYSAYENYFNHYFRNLYHIFKLIYFSDLNREQKKMYASIARAQLSQSELLLLAFNGIIRGYGYPRFAYLMREYDILQNFGWSQITVTSFRKLIQYKLNTINYPFELMKPKERNFE